MLPLAERIKDRERRARENDELAGIERDPNEPRKATTAINWAEVQGSEQEALRAAENVTGTVDDDSGEVTDAVDGAGSGEQATAAETQTKPASGAKSGATAEPKPTPFKSSKNDPTA